MTYKEVRRFLTHKLEIYLKRKWIDKANKVAEILNILAEVMPKSKNPYLPEDYMMPIKVVSQEEALRIYPKSRTKPKSNPYLIKPIVTPTPNPTRT